MQVTFPEADNHRLANLCGALDENLRQIETALNVNIARRGEVFNVTPKLKDATNHTYKIDVGPRHHFVCLMLMYQH